MSAVQVTVLWVACHLHPSRPRPDICAECQTAQEVNARGPMTGVRQVTT